MRPPITDHIPPDPYSFSNHLNHTPTAPQPHPNHTPTTTQPHPNPNPSAPLHHMPHLISIPAQSQHPQCGAVSPGRCQIALVDGDSRSFSRARQSVGAGARAHRPLAFKRLTARASGERGGVRRRLDRPRYPAAGGSPLTHRGTPVRQHTRQHVLKENTTI